MVRAANFRSSTSPSDILPVLRDGDSGEPLPEPVAVSVRGRYRGRYLGYCYAHIRLGDAKAHRCPCGKQALDWAYQHKTAPKDRRLISRAVSTQGRMYSLFREDYLPCCRACHTAYDGLGAFKLTIADVMDIRLRHNSDTAGYRKLAREFGVSRTHIKRIVKRKRWAAHAI